MSLTPHLFRRTISGPELHWCRCQVPHLSNRKAVIVPINDHGPCIRSRIITVTKEVARTLDFVNAGGPPGT
ncbi:MAG: hypothetical protein GY872_05300 [Roseibacillus sp.]|nr:hypothetical protein [Roseibacillus sp.]